MTDSASLKEVGTRLIAARESAGLTQQQASEKTQIPTERLERLEQGKSVIEAAEVLRLTGCYDISADTLFDGIADMDGGAVSEADVVHLIEHMLRHDDAGRGQHFKDLVAAVKATN